MNNNNNITLERIHSLKDMKEWISYERIKYGENKRINHFVKKCIGNENAILCSFQIRLRKTEYYINWRHKFRALLRKVLLNRYSNKYGLHIAPNVFGKGLKIMHLGHILTNGKVRAGENISIHVNTSLVAKGTTDEVPTLGNDIVIGVGACLLGNITIADGVAISANSVCTKSIEEEGIAVAGAPAQKVSNNGKRKWGQKR